MGVNDSLHLRPRLVDLTMNIAFAIDAPSLRIDQLTIDHADFQNVRLGNERWRHRLRHQEDIRILVRPRSDVAEGVENAFVHQNSIGGDNVILQSVIGIRGALRRSAC